MTPDSTASPIENPATIPSTAGMTTKVIKGSLWTIAGQMLPLGVSLLTTPIVIRLLGTEGYGTLLLVLLIPIYLGFADFGMGLASTKFGSEAYASGSYEKEARIVRTAALIAFLTSLPAAAFIFIFAGTVIEWFGPPATLRESAILALRLSAITLVLNFLCLIFNTPQLSRLRMELNTIVSAGFRTLGLIATPIVLHFGGGLVGAILVLLIVSVFTLLGHLIVSYRLLNELSRLTIEREAVRPMLRFGGALVVGSIAGLLLVNAEKLVLTYTTSVKTLAYYSVAFALATMAATFSQAMTQSLIPAFSQLLRPEKFQELNNLFSRALRLNLVVMLPLLAILFVVAERFFTIWAGEDFGRESTFPFYILLSGLFFNILAFVPGSLVLSAGKTGMLAKLYWLELVPFIVLVALLTSQFGALGAALAWSTRVIVDAFWIGYLARRTIGISFRIFDERFSGFVVAAAVLILPAVVTVFFTNSFVAVAIILSFSLVGYFVIAWRAFFSSEERFWLSKKLYGFVNR